MIALDISFISSSINVNKEKIADEAAKQCGRGIKPQVLSTMRFQKAVLDAAAKQTAIFLYESEQTVSMRQAMSAHAFETCAVMVGPEGGFDPTEYEAAINAGMVSVTLGARILRCETAPLCALSLILYHIGDI